MVRITKETFPLTKIKDVLEKEFRVAFKYHSRGESEWITSKTRNGFVTIAYYTVEETGESFLRFSYDESFFYESEIIDTYEALDKWMTKYFKERERLKLF